MKIFNLILGILSIIGAIYSIFYPRITFLNIGWIVTVLLGVWGICSIVDYAINCGKKQNSKGEAFMGVLGLVFGIVAAVASVLAVFVPSIKVVLDIIILCIFSGWLIISGINSAVSSFKVRKSGSKSWILTLICGILVLVAGIYGYFNLIFVARTIGFIMGILLLVYGLRLVVSVFEKADR